MSEEGNVYYSRKGQTSAELKHFRRLQNSFPRLSLSDIGTITESLIFQPYYPCFQAGKADICARFSQGKGASIYPGVHSLLGIV